MLTVPKKELYLVLPFFGKISALVKAGLTRSLHKRLPFCKVKIAFKTSNRLKIILLNTSNRKTFERNFVNLCERSHA